MTDVRAIVIDGFGDPPHLATFPLPELAPGQVLIEVQATSVNAFDWKAADGRFKDSFDYQFPVTIGRDYAGVVSAVGGEVSRVAPGDEVFGYFTGQALHRGAFATHVWAGEDEAYLRELGAADVVEPGAGLIDVVRARYPEGINGLIDLVDYRPAFLAHAELLVPGGRAASVHRAVDEVLFAGRGLHGTNVASFPDRALLEQLANLAGSGKLRTVITGRYTLDQAPAALAAARDEHTRGKLVIEIAP